jgi:hypothetical protein
MKPLTELRARPGWVLTAQVLLVVAAIALIESAWSYAAETEWRRLTGDGEFLYLAILYAAAAATAIAALVGLGRRRRWAPPAGVGAVVLGLLLDLVWPVLDPQTSVSFQPVGLAVELGLAVAVMAFLLLPATWRWCDLPTGLAAPAPDRPPPVTRTLVGLAIVALVFLVWNPILVEDAVGELWRYGDDRTVTVDVMVTISVLTGLGYLAAAVALRAGRSWPRRLVPALAVPAVVVGGYIGFGLGFGHGSYLGYPDGRYAGFGLLAIGVAVAHAWWIRHRDTEYWLDQVNLARAAETGRPRERS